MIKFYSDKLKKFFDTVDACEEAEKAAELAEQKKKEEADKKNIARKEDAAKVEEAYKKYAESQKVTDNLYKDYIAAKKEFIDKYNQFHLTDNNGDVKVTTVSDFFSDFIDTFNLLGW